MTKLTVNSVDADKNDESLYKTKQISVGGPPISTPIMAYNNNLIRSDEQVAPATRGLNEIYCEVETQKTSLEKLVSNPDATDSLDERIRLQTRKTNANEINICVLECNIDEYPPSEQWEFVLDTTHAHSDIVPIPNIPIITSDIVDSEDKFSKYLAFLEESIRYLKVINEKPIMGMIPKLSYSNTRRLVEFYINHDLNAFCVDFAARNMITAKRDCLNVLKTLKNHEKIENSFLYAYNVNSGRLTKTVDAVPAKDILSFGFGFDALGRKHKRPKVRAEVWSKINTLPAKVRLFNKTDYGYYRVINSEKITEVYPPDSCFTKEKFAHFLTLSTTELRRCEGLFNTEQLGMEAYRLRQIIKNDKPIEYISKKTYVKKETIKTMNNFKNSISSNS
ncbi:MAG: hypothetical protein LAN71_17610 [Acidobacteriia bacterium]|nr:hypothetical protein [Terriglobia bacterium]